MVLGALALGLAAQASAVNISFQYNGTLSGTNPQTTTATNFFANPGGVIGTGLTYTYPTTATFTNGTGTVTTAAGSIQFAMTGTYVANNVSGAILSFSNGTGAYAGYTGTGSLSHTFVAGSTVGGQFSANIVPEPASMLAFGLGGVAVLRRRARRTR